MKLTTALAMIAVLAAPAAAWSQGTYSDLFFFGDSLSDTGRACRYVSLTPYGYAYGHCSNGPVWAEYFADELGLPDAAVSFDSTPPGHNFAAGGVETDSLASQIADLTGLVGTSLDSDALYVIWMGGNDIINEVAFGSSGPNAMEDAVQNIVAAINQLTSMGADEFLIVNAPDVGRTYGNPYENKPFVDADAIWMPGARDEVTALSIEFNTLLDAALDGITGVTIHRMDAFNDFEAAFLDPEQYGIDPSAIDTTSDDTDFGIPCIADPVCQLDPQGALADSFILFDAIHPTTALHAVTADNALTAIGLPEPGSALGLASGSLMLLALARRRGHC